MPGVRHPPQADIESIRDLLRGYTSSKNILKELIQNAEDAGASRMDLLYVPGRVESPLSLMRGPALLVVNNGEFKPEHQKAIFQINLGTKGTDERAIGRFGKGLKSVFAWCEAFFICANTSPEDWPLQDHEVSFFNPWCDWRHEEWEREFETYKTIVFFEVKKALSSIYTSRDKWLAFSIPLREQRHATDSMHSADLIVQGGSDQFPGEDATFLKTVSSAFIELAPSLVVLRSLSRIVIRRVDDEVPLVNWEFPKESERVPAPDDSPQMKIVKGNTVLQVQDLRDTALSYCGIAGRLKDDDVYDLKSAKDWPTVVNNAGIESSAKVKGVPHFATVLTAEYLSDISQDGILDIVLSVFFPVGRQPQELRTHKLKKIPLRITLNLHGFFFLDSERLRIEGLEDRFAPKNAASNMTCVEWNRRVATLGTLAHLPSALYQFGAQENLANAQCLELSDELQQTWIWSNFCDAICEQYYWLPLWTAGEETWQCVSANTPILPIPKVEDANELMSCIPQLARISTGPHSKIVSKRANRSVPGIHRERLGHWPEVLVLSLLENVEVDARHNESTAAWLNKFLDQLQEEGSLIEPILKRVSTLPLLSIHYPASNSSFRINATQWSELVGTNRLFQSNSRWLHLLSAALHPWDYYLAGRRPDWFKGPPPAVCNGELAAQITLSRGELGSLINRRNLVSEFGTLTSRDLDTRLAMRFLMHGNPNHARNIETELFVPSTQADGDVWFRLIDQVLSQEGRVDRWRLLYGEWAQVLSPQLQSELNIVTLDAHGAWKELIKDDVDAHLLDFAVDQWSQREISIVIEGLNRAGNTRREDTIALLRQLRLHTLRGRGEERVSVANELGQLAEGIVLDSPDLAADLPRDLEDLWTQLISETKIVERLADDDLAQGIQDLIFRWTDNDGNNHPAILNWNYVVRHSLGVAKPEERAPLILEALKHGDQVVRGIGPLLKSKRWLPLKLGTSCPPNAILHIEGFEEEFDRMFDFSVDGFAGIRALRDEVLVHEGFNTLRKYFPQTREVLGALGLWLSENAGWHLGLTNVFPRDELVQIVSELQGIDSLSVVPLLKKLIAYEHQPGFASMVEELILPQVSKPFDYSHDGKKRLKQILLLLQAPSTRVAFDAYLKQACEDNVLREILPELSLVNKRGHWVSARKLIWPSTNLDPSAQLCDQQAKILSSLNKPRESSGEQSAGEHSDVKQCRLRQLSEPPDFEAAAGNLKEYLEPFTVGSIGYNLPAALAVSLGGHPAMVAVSEELLRSDLGQERDDFILGLLGEHATRLSNELDRIRFLIEIVAGETIEAESITGEKITVGLTSEITTLLVGNPSDLWYTFEYQSRTDTACHIARLRRVQNPDALEDAAGIFASTIESILLRAHCNNDPGLCPNNLKATLADLVGAGQTDLRRSQIYLLDMAESRLKELGVKGVAAFDDVLKKFNDARRARVDAEWLTGQAPTRALEKVAHATNLMEAAKKELIALLESTDSDITCRPLVNAIRRKMRDFQYTLRSIALELFQNADDAAAELAEMKKEISAQEKSFVVRLHSPNRVLDILHWGRPINRYEYPGFSEGSKRGFDQDLQKMLTLNFSDKGLQEAEGPNLVTGCFGLGFKTVFFLCEQPQVISGRLAFGVRGGFYPVALDQSTAQEIREDAKSWGDGGEPTAIRLQWDGSERDEQVSKLVESFCQVSPLLAIFSRNVETIITVEDESITRYVREEKPLTSSGRATHVKVGNSSFLCFRCPIESDQRPATVLFRIDPNGITDLPDDLTGIWITTPTSVRSKLRWALNAPFKPDAGRQLLALSNDENRKLAEKIAAVWGEILIELFDETRSDWPSFVNEMDLHEAASFENFWHQLWVQTTRSAPIVDFGRIEGGELLNWISWENSIGAMSRLIRERNAIPSELPDQYSQMLRLEDVQFSLTGMIGDLTNGLFARVAKWNSTQTTFPPGQVVQTGIAGILQSAGCALSVRKVNLRAVIEKEIGSQHKVDCAPADRIGKLFSDCKAVLDLSTANADEVLDLINFIKPFKFLAQDGNFQPGNELVSSRAVSKLVDEDEALRAAFAPGSAVLSENYSLESLTFFVRARGQLTADAKRMATWSRRAEGERLSAVFRYLANGELGQQLAVELTASWLDEKRSTPEWAELEPIDKSEIERKFLKGRIWSLPPFEPDEPQQQPVKQEMNAGDAFILVSRWWKVEGGTWASKYDQCTYPIGFPGDLPWPGEVEWDDASSPSPQARWLMVFIQAAFVPLGLNVIGRDRRFSEFLLSERWLDILVNVRERPEALLIALDEYLDKFIEKTDYHFQMRQFVAFYAVAKNLEAFLLSLKESERSGNFSQAISPRANPALRNTGIDAPPLNGLFGIGSCHLIRELYRLGRLANSSGHSLAFTPIRKVRRLCMQLFGVSDLLQGNAWSANIHSKFLELNEGLTWDPTFNKCFDLPFQFLAEDPKLQQRVLGQELEPSSEDFGSDLLD